ncbi:hypothetical protein CCR94_19180 [Rhodoblastus sphagnicola]|uniref:Uncharacterized protein n=2 Tax=Rhodoblastus sphagnicola TaxID=333368 RepID=A0A2S6MZL3_9HYPH|nr:hypothetical protein CCR94_19180 [Rhodoblastus sphagnicola]
MTTARELAGAPSSDLWLDRLEETVDAAMLDQMRLPMVKPHLAAALRMVRSMMARKHFASRDERQDLQAKIDRTLAVMDKVDRLVRHYDGLLFSQTPSQPASGFTPSDRPVEEAEFLPPPETKPEIIWREPRVDAQPSPGVATVDGRDAAIPKLAAGLNVDAAASISHGADLPPAVFSVANLDRAELLAALRIGPNGDGRAPFIMVRNKPASVYRLLERRFNVDPSASDAILRALLAEGAIQIKLRGLPPGGEVRPSIVVAE